MPSAILRPNGTVTNTFTVTNAPTAHEALDDAVTQPASGSEADGFISSVQNGQSVNLEMTTVAMASNEKVVAVRVWVEATNVSSAGVMNLRAIVEAPGIEPKFVTGADWQPPAGGIYAWRQAASITGAAINQTDLDSIRMRFTVVLPAGATGTQVRIRAAYMEVDYENRIGAGTAAVEFLTTYATGTDAYIYNSPAYVPVPGRPMFAWVFGGHANQDVPTPTVSGNGQSWVYIHTATRPGGGGATTRKLFLFRASGSSATPGGFTADWDNPQSGTRTTSAIDMALIAVVQGNASVHPTTIGTYAAMGDDVFDTQQSGFIANIAHNNSGILACFNTSTTLTRIPDPGWTKVAEVDNDPMGMAVVYSAQPDSTPGISWTGGTAHGATSIIELPEASVPVPTSSASSLSMQVI